MDNSQLSILDGGSISLGDSRSLSEALDRVIACRPQSGLTCLDRAGVAKNLSYTELRSRGRKRWSQIAEDGISAGDVAILLSDDPLELLELAWACFIGGAVAAPLAAPLDFSNDAAGVKRLNDALSVLPSAKIVLPPSLSDSADAVRAAIAARAVVIETEPLDLGACDDVPVPSHSTKIAVMLFTSGSTGLPKAVPLSHVQILLRSNATAEAVPFLPDHIALNWMPLDHVGGIVMMHLSPLVVGCSQVQIPTAYILTEPTRWLDAVDVYRATHLWAPNFAFGLVNERLRRPGRRYAWDLAHVHTIVNGGEAVNPATFNLFLQSLAPYGLSRSVMRPMWGMSETASGSIVASQLRDDLVPGAASIGCPMPGLALRLVDDSGVVVPRGSLGILQVKGPYVISRYEAADAAANAAFVGDGWFSTGDEGVLVEGELVLVGRASETIIINGVNHHSPAIEMAIEQCDWVRPGHVAVCGARLEGSDTDQPIVFVSTQEDASLGPLQEAEIRKILSRQFGISPAAIIKIRPDQFPRTGLGKIQRKLLARSFQAGEFQADDRPKNLSAPSPLLSPAWIAQDTPLSSRTGIVTWSIDPIAEPPLTTVLLHGDLARLVAERNPAASHAARGHIIIMDADNADRASLYPTLAADGANLLRLSENDEELHVAIIAVSRFAPRIGTVNPTTAARIAYFQNAAAEAANLTVTVMHVQAGQDSADRILCELDACVGEEVVLDANVRMVRRLSPIEKQDTGIPSGWKRGGSYLLTGSGDVSHAVASYLIKEFDAQVVILSRSDKGDRPTIPGCTYVKGDVTNEADVAEAMQVSAAKGPLTAILHLAAKSKEWPLTRMNVDVIAEVMDAKVTGLDTLLRAIEHRGIEVPVVVFSSLLAWFHGPLYGPYVAANRYMEAVAYQRFPLVRAVAYGSWDRLGMSKAMPHGNHAHNIGFGTLPLEAAFEGLRLACTLDEPIVLVGTNLKGTKVQHLLAANDFSDAISSDLITVEIRTNDDSLPCQDAEAETRAMSEFNERERSLALGVLSIGKIVLRTDNLSLMDNFFRRGGDSLGIAELHSQLCELSGTDLPMVPLFMAENFIDVIRFVADPESYEEAAQLEPAL